MRSASLLSSFPRSAADMRASSVYRLKVARNLLLRFQLETRDTAPLALCDVNAFAYETVEAHAASAKEPS